MSIFQVNSNELKALVETSFGAEGIMERRDLQRLLRDQINVIDENLMVIAEEFGDWVESSRRIDLLCIDTDANLVVVELKRSDDGGHMELQALRYAAMVSAMTFEQLVDTFARYKSRAEPNVETAKSTILEFLNWDGVYEDEFAQETRIVLAAADFSKELTTAVMWLVESGIDIRCVRMKPYRMDDGTVLLNVEQLIPLPEAANFQTQIGVKRQAERQNRSQRHDLRLKFWEGLLEQAKTKTAVHANRSPTRENWISGGVGKNGLKLIYSILQNESRVELEIAFGPGQRERNKVAFRALESQRADIEAEFGAALDWQELPNADKCRISYSIIGGYKSPPEQWPEIQTALADAMAKMERVMKPRIANL